MPLRIATFNVENLDDGATIRPPLAERVQIMRPQLERVSADILCPRRCIARGRRGPYTGCSRSVDQHDLLCDIQQGDDADHHGSVV